MKKIVILLFIFCASQIQITHAAERNLSEDILLGSFYIGSFTTLITSFLSLAKCQDGNSLEIKKCPWEFSTLIINVISWTLFLIYLKKRQSRLHPELQNQNLDPF